MILVTGATGHVGNVLVRRLISLGKRVRAMVLPGEDLSPIEDLAVETVQADVLDPGALERAMSGVDYVYHLAGIISILPGQEALMQQVNVQGVQNVVDAALKAGVRRLVHTSSIHALKRMPHGVTVDESIPVSSESPAGDYDRTKAEGTLAVLNAVNRGLDAVIVCPTGVIGPYDFRKSEMGQTILGYAKKRLHFLVDGAYDFVDVRDVANSLEQACYSGRKGEIYILSGARILIREIRQIVQELVGVYSPALVIPYRLASLAARFAEPFYRWSRRVPQFTRYSLQTVRDNSIFSHEKASRELGHNPRPLRQSIADTLAWWRERKLASLRF